MADRLAGYLLEERVAVGGMAEIFRARREGPGGFAKQVAIKRLLPDLSRDRRFVKMFLEEARIQSQLSCRTMVQVFDFGEEAGSYYLVMEYVEGVDLDTLLSRGPLPVDLAVHVARELCEALDHIHNHSGPDGLTGGIVHRDVTPANVLISRSGEVKLADFGIAKARASQVRTATGTVKGKLAYLSPEAARGDAVDGRTDIYGLGLVLFELLTGVRYLEADTDAALLRLAESPHRRTAAALRPEIPAALDEIVGRALEKQAEERFVSARQLDGALMSIGLDADSASLRGRLGAMVETTSSAVEPASAVTSEGPAVDLEVRTALSHPAAEGASPRTLQVDVLAGARRRWWRTGALGAVLLLMLVVAAGWWRSQSHTTIEIGDATESLPESAAPPSRELSPVAAPPVDAPPVDAPLIVAPPGVAPPGVGASRTPPRVAPPTRTSRPAAAATVATSPTDSGPRPPDASAARVQQLLLEISQGITRRGLLSDDAPEIHRELQLLTRTTRSGGAPVEAVEALAARVAAFPIDRSFIDAKLQRVSRLVQRRELASAPRDQVRRRTQAALSLAVSGRFEAANRELNEIVAMVQP